MKENFYVFIDIDGTLWDLDYLLNSIAFQSYKYFRQPNINSLKALDYLIDQLKKDYNVHFVISSFWRKNSERDFKIMKEFGLKYDGLVETTPLNIKKKGKAILEYLKDKPDNKNVVILEDSLRLVKDEFDNSCIIKTNRYKESLSNRLVDNFLAKLKMQNEVAEKEF